MKNVFLILNLVSVLICAASLSARQDRIITLGGPVTEIVFALGLGDSVVAVDSSSTFPEAVRSLPQVGYVSSLNAEGVLSERPSMIVSTSRMGPPSVVDQLRSSGISLHLIQTPHDAASLRSAIVELAELLGRAEAGHQLWAVIEAELEEARRVMSGVRAPRAVFLMGSNGGAMAAGRETQGNGIIALAGAQPIFGEFTGYKPVTEEALIAASPDVLLVGSRSGGTSDFSSSELLAPMGLGRLAEVLPVRVIPIGLGEYLTFGPRTGQSALRLAKLLAAFDE